MKSKICKCARTQSTLKHRNFETTNQQQISDNLQQNIANNALIVSHKGSP